MKLTLLVQNTKTKLKTKIKFPIDENKYEQIIQEIGEIDDDTFISQIEFDYDILYEYIKKYGESVSVDKRKQLLEWNEIEQLNELFDMDETDVLEVMQILQQSKDGDIDDDYWYSSISLQIDQVKSGYNFVFHPDITDESDLKNIIEDLFMNNIKVKYKKEKFLEFILYYVDWDWQTKDLIQSGDFNFQVTDYGTLQIND